MNRSRSSRCVLGPNFLWPRGVVHLVKVQCCKNLDILGRSIGGTPTFVQVQMSVYIYPGGDMSW